MAHPGILLGKLMAQEGSNPNRLSKATGVPQPTIYRILMQFSKNPTRDKLEPLARHYRIKVDDFYKDETKATKIRAPSPFEMQMERIARAIATLPVNRQAYLMRQVDSLLEGLDTL